MKTVLSRRLRRIYRKFLKNPQPRPKLFEFAISVYTGSSPFDLRPASGHDLPVLTWRDVNDVEASFVADPFLLRRENEWFMFFEIFGRGNKKGEIALATSKDGLNWEYLQVVMTEPFHLSYPFVFEWRGEIYIVPEAYQSGAVRLYRAEKFPTRWVYVKDLLQGPYLTDATLTQANGRWWLFVETNPEARFDTLRLFYSHDLMGAWVEHPLSPIVRGNNRIARPAGRIVQRDTRLYRFAQDCYPNYGTHVRAFEITELNPSGYSERQLDASPILRARGAGWNAAGMHHVDAQELETGQWLAAVDGWRWLDN